MSCCFAFPECFTFLRQPPKAKPTVSALPDLDQACVDARNDPCTLARRSLVVCAKLLPVTTCIVGDLLRCGGPKHAAKNTRRLRIALEKLGPAFIKLGQAIAAREDILSKEVAAELRKLCDQVIPISLESARAMLAEELGDNAPIIEGEPVAAASLGQVYKIRIKNRELAMKIQRPGLAEELVYDIVILLKLAACIRKAYSWFAVSSIDLVGVTKSWSQTLWHELDYQREARSMEYMYNCLVGRVSGLVIPQVYWPLSSLRVLTTEWINGARITSEAGALKARHVTIGVEAFATMVLDIGFVHADPHAGNVLITIPGNDVCLLDFGMVVEVPPDHRLAWAKCLYCMIRRDHNSTLQHLMDLGFFPPDCPRERILAVMPAIWNELVACGSDIEKRKQAIQKCSREILTFVREFEFALPDYYIALGRAMLTLEGIAIAADMEFDIFKAAAPMVIRYLAKQGKTETAQLGRTVAAKIKSGVGSCRRRFAGSKVSPELALQSALLLTMVGAGLGAAAMVHATKDS